MRMHPIGQDQSDATTIDLMDKLGRLSDAEIRAAEFDYLLQAIGLYRSALTKIAAGELTKHKAVEAAALGLQQGDPYRAVARYARQKVDGR